MSFVSEAVWNWVNPRVLNYEALGNAEPHLHWHIFPRHEDDPSPNTASWKVPREVRYSEKYRPTSDELAQYREELLAELNRVLA